MRFSIAALAACVASAQAFRDTSPFLIFSSSSFPPPLSDLSKTQLQPESHLLYRTQFFLRFCPSTEYYIIVQPSLSSHDVTTDAFPTFQQHIGAGSVKDKLMISNVQGLDSSIPDQLIKAIKAGCGEKNVVVLDAENGVITADFVPERRLVHVLNFDDGDLKGGRLSEDPKRREVELRDNDARIDRVLSHIGNDYTVIYTSTPVNGTITKKETEEGSYQADFVDPAHIDLKRDLEIRVPDKTEQTDFRPLFETYQFLTPGLFMGLLVGLIMITILGVGMRALSSLQVSYGAFDKEMGPAAQRKQQ